MKHAFTQRWPTWAATGLLAVSSVAGAEMVIVERALESVEMEVRVDRSGDGYVTGRQCEKCRPERFTITPNTRFFENGREVGRERAVFFGGAEGVIIYNPENRHVNRIRKW